MPKMTRAFSALVESDVSRHIKTYKVLAGAAKLKQRCFETVRVKIISKAQKPTIKSSFVLSA